MELPAAPASTTACGKAMQVTVMGLSAREQQALHSIEDRLAGSDPQLASLLATFTRLTAGEAMPARGQSRAARRRATRGARHARRHPSRNRVRRRACRLYQRLGWQRAMLLLWLLIATTLVAAALAISHRSGNRTCMAVWPVACAQQTSARAARSAGNS